MRLPFGPPANEHYASFWRKAMADESSPLRDVTLVVGAAQQKIPCNRILISSHSGFLARYFEDEKHLQTNKGHSIIPLPDLDGPAVEAIVAALASQTLECSLEQLEEICRAADFLDVANIKAAFENAVQEWGEAKAAEGSEKHAAFLLWLAQLGDRYHVPALLEYACKSVVTAPEALLTPHIGDWPAALLPHLWQKHLATVADAAKAADAARAQLYDSMRELSATRSELEMKAAQLRNTAARLVNEQQAKAAKAVQIRHFEHLHRNCTQGPPTLATFHRRVALCPSDTDQMF